MDVYYGMTIFLLNCINNFAQRNKLIVTKMNSKYFKIHLIVGFLQRNMKN